MTISVAMNVSVTAMQSQTQRLAGVARTVATGDMTGAAASMLDLSTIEHEFAANASVFETGADMWDVLATIVRD